MIVINKSLSAKNARLKIDQLLLLEINRIQQAQHSHRAVSRIVWTPGASGAQGACFARSSSRVLRAPACTLSRPFLPYCARLTPSPSPAMCGAQRALPRACAEQLLWPGGQGGQLHSFTPWSQSGLCDSLVSWCGSPHCPPPLST